MPPERRIIDDALYAHFVTFSVYRRRRLLKHDRAGRIVLEVLDLVVERAGSGVWPGGTSGQDNDFDSDRY